MYRATAVLLGIFISLNCIAQSIPPYKNPDLPVAERVKDLLSRMTAEEKFWQLFMIPGDLSGAAPEKYHNGLFGFQVSAGAGQSGQLLKYNTTEKAALLSAKINAIQKYFVNETRLGIPIIAFDEGLHGLVREGATAFPQAIGLAATWDTSLMHKVAAVIANESRQRGIRQLLSPVVNIASDPRWGRTEETYGEDPYLSAEMGVAFVSELEKAGVISTPKHFIANAGDGGKDSYPIHFNERLLNEIYLVPFKACIQRGGSRSIMTSYNSLNGSPATANDWLLNTVLKKDWQFKGFVISDAGAVGGANVLHYTAKDYPDACRKAITHGLDVIFQTAYDHYRLFIPPFLDSSISQSRIDDAVSRVLTAKFELGLFENPYTHAALPQDTLLQVRHKALARQAALESVVLLKNDKELLPLTNRFSSIAVIGADAIEKRLGGYSGPGNQVVSILDGIIRRAGKNIKVSYAPGCGHETHDLMPVEEKYLFSGNNDQEHGLKGDYFSNIQMTGLPAIQRIDKKIDFQWTLYGPDPALPASQYAVRWSGKLLAPATGSFKIGLEGDDGYRLYINNKLIIDNWQKISYHLQAVRFYFEKNKAYDLRIEFYETTGNAHLKLVWNFGVNDDWRSAIKTAVETVKHAGTAIVVAGINEGEFRDRAMLDLPGHQEEMISQIAATGKPVIVILIGGSAITMQNWIGKTGAVIDAWYSGEEGGNAVAAVLFGDYNPAGRLPVSFPMQEGQLPWVYNHKPTGRGDDYADLSGMPLFPFGYGLSYTRFEYSNMQQRQQGDSFLVSCRIKNTGKTGGEEVAQMYIHDELASVARPVMELKGFQRIMLLPGEEKEITFVITRDMLSMYNDKMEWVAEPGAFKIMIGSSSKEIRLSSILTLE